MKKRYVCMFVVCLLSAMPAMAELQLRDGRWQLELSGSAGIDSGGEERSGDYMLKTTLEYEVPFSSHLALGLRALPLFVYEQDDSDEDTLWGGGLGLGLRLYSVADEYRGWFAEAGAHALGHKHQFAGNSSNINFLTGLGVGYKCKEGWHSVLRWEHISNANLGEHNSGVNLLSLGVGFSF